MTERITEMTLYVPIILIIIQQFFKQFLSSYLMNYSSIFLLVKKMEQTVLINQRLYNEKYLIQWNLYYLFNYFRN